MRCTETELRNSARSEFQKGRDLKDLEEIYRRLVVGRDALYQVQEKVRGYI